MRISVVGCGFVGLTTGVALAHLGYRVHLVDINKNRLSSITEGESPFYEPLLDKMLMTGLKNKTITMGSDIEKAVKTSKFIIIAVQTPVDKGGSSNLSFLLKCSRSIARSLSAGKIIIIKSTVPPGTTLNKVVPILESDSGLKAGKDFGIVMNPEFLQEGRAIKDTLEPSRIIVGSLKKKHGEQVMSLFHSIDAPKLITDIPTAEMIKLVSNCFLATKISFANEIANLCEKVGVDVVEVMDGVGLDDRIGRRFLNAGLGFGGSCLPKDLSALIAFSRNHDLNLRLLKATESVNSAQPLRAVDLLEETLGSLKGKKIAILGLAFKSGVDDVRDTRALPIATELVSRGATVMGYDPLANENFQKLLPSISLKPSIKDALFGADGCIIQTEEKEFAKLRQQDFSGMRNRFVIDGRRVIQSPKKLTDFGINIKAIGLGDTKSVRGKGGSSAK